MTEEDTDVYTFKVIGKDNAIKVEGLLDANGIEYEED